jgi:hypothetical protein
MDPISQAVLPLCIAPTAILILFAYMWIRETQIRTTIVAAVVILVSVVIGNSLGIEHQHWSFCLSLPIPALIFGLWRAAMLKKYQEKNLVG